MSNANFGKKFEKEAVKMFLENTAKFHDYANKLTSGNRGSFVPVGRDTGRLNRSLYRKVFNKTLVRVGFGVKYASEVLLRKGSTNRGILGSNGLFYQYWKSLWK